MKKCPVLLSAAMLSVFLLGGCGKNSTPVPSTISTTPSAASSPSVPVREAIGDRVTEEPVHTVSPEDLASIEATIEDGNGPIPSQNLLPGIR